MEYSLLFSKRVEILYDLRCYEIINSETNCCKQKKQSKKNNSSFLRNKS